jgi:hypothetical protein
MDRTGRFTRWAVTLALAATALAGCASSSTTTEETSGGATVEPVAGTELSSVTLTEQAADRLGIQVGAVEQADAGRTKLPYAAVLYDPQGETWAFTQAGDLRYVRAPIAIDRIEGDVTFLTSGPPVGTAVVTIGAAELYGAEIGIGHD